MKIINSNGWAPRNVKWASYHEWSGPVPITSQSILSDGNLYHSFYVYREAGRLAKFYYIYLSLIRL